MLLAGEVHGKSKCKSASHIGKLVVAGAFDNERCWDSIFLKGRGLRSAALVLLSQI
jgi:hypothetical protein